MNNISQDDIHIDFKAIFERSFSPDVLLKANPPFYTIVAVTDSYLQATHTTREDIIGKSLFDIFPDSPDQTNPLTLMKQMLLRVINKKQPQGFEGYRYDIYVKEQNRFEERYWTNSNRPVMNSVGEVAYILNTTTDITETIKLKNAQALSQELAEAHQTRLELAMEAAELGVWEYDLINKKSVRSLKYDHIFGFPEGAKDWARGTFRKMIYPDDREMVEQAHDLAYKTGTLKYETRIIRADSSIRWIDVLGKAIFDEHHNPVKLLGTIRDITEIKQQQQHKDEFISVVSHELKTPITSLKAFTQILFRQYQKKGDDKAALFLSKMNHQINKINLIIQDLLDITRIDEGKIQYRKEDFQVRELVEEIVEVVQRTCDSHTINTMNNSCCTVKADRERTGQVLTNLLINAIKYSPQANEVLVKVEESDGTITVSVQDYGLGIPEEQQNLIFKRFSRISDEKVNMISGLGLGLYISAEIIKRQNGKIWFSSKKGEGSTFCFSLPVTEGISMTAG